MRDMKDIVGMVTCGFQIYFGRVSVSHMDSRSNVGLCNIHA